MSTEGLIVEETSFELPLAAIDGIADLLGETNQISINAFFDLGADPSASEIQLFSSDVIGKQLTAQTIAGLNRPNLLFGSDLGDTI